MKTFLKVITVILTMGIVGNLTQGKISPITIILTIVCMYFGWFHKKDEEIKE